MQQPFYQQQQTAPRLTLALESDARTVGKGFRQTSIALDIAQLLHDAAQTTLGERRESIYSLPQPERMLLMQRAQAAIQSASQDAQDIAHWAAAQRLYTYDCARSGHRAGSIWHADPEIQRRYHDMALSACVAYQKSLEGMDAHAGLGGSTGRE